MGLTFNAVRFRDGPFQSIDERVFVIPSGKVVKPRTDFFKLNFLLEGRCFHEIDGQNRVLLQKGDILIIPKLCQQKWFSWSNQKESKIHSLRLLFNPKHAPPYTGIKPSASLHLKHRNPEMHFSSFLQHNFPQIVHLPNGQDAEMAAIMKELRKEAEERFSGFRYRIQAFCFLLVVLVARKSHHHQAQYPASEKQGVHLVNAAKEYILKSLHTDLKLGQIAWQIGKSEEHLARIFKEVTGQTVFSFVRQMRLEQAKHYLINSEKTLTEIAFQSGFSSLSLFSRNFKAYAGLNPSVYRQKQVGKFSTGGHDVDGFDTPARFKPEYKFF